MVFVLANKQKNNFSYKKEKTFSFFEFEYVEKTDDICSTSADTFLSFLVECVSRERKQAITLNVSHTHAHDRM